MLNQTKTSTPILGIELLRSFTKKELQKFKLFIESSYFNTDIKLIRLFEIIQKEVLNRDFTETLQTKVYVKVFNKKVSEKLSENERKILRTKLSKLNQLTNQFLVVESLNENKNTFNDLLYTSLLNKRLLSSFLFLFKRDKKQMNAKPRKEIRDFEHLYNLEMHYLEYLFLSGLLYKKPDYKVSEINYKLDIEYLIKKLSLHLMILSNDFLPNINSREDSTLDYLKSLQELPQYKIHPYIIVQSSTIDFIRNSKKISYNQLLNLLSKYNEQIPLNELKAFYLIIMNFLINQIKKGHFEFEKHMIELFDLLDSRNLLVEEKMMPAVKLKNIVNRMSRSGFFKKSRYYTEKYISYIRKEDRKSVYHDCLGTIAFYEKDYEKALDYIIQVDHVNISFESNRRILMMKIYYERDQSYSEKTERLYRTAEKFFNDNKSLSSLNKKSYKNFTQILLNLYRFKHNEGRMTLEKLQTKLDQQEYNIDKKWLLEKMEELKK